MIKKYLGIALVASSMLIIGCSSSDDEASDAAAETATAGDMSGETGDTGDTGDTGRWAILFGCYATVCYLSHM